MGGSHSYIVKNKELRVMCCECVNPDYRKDKNKLIQTQIIDNMTDMNSLINDEPFDQSLKWNIFKTDMYD